MGREFHDLAEAALNHESGGDSCWGNLGYWADADTYPQACTALADQLGERLRLGADTHLLDVGFGCGDQLLRWLEHFGVRDLAGINLSYSQTGFARQRLTGYGHAEIAARLQVGDATRLQDAGHDDRDTVLALDCAYHFPSRQQFLKEAANLLPPGGRIGVTDLVLARQDLGLRETLALRGIARLSRIPRRNLVTAETYQAQMRDAGFELESWTDITSHVFLPFGDWLRRYRGTLDPALERGTHWGKYTATASFLRWSVRNDVLRYVICTGRRV